MSASKALDTSAPMGRFVLPDFAALTELGSEQIRESWEATHPLMISRGVRTGPHVPVRCRKGKRLLPIEHAAYVQEALVAANVGLRERRPLGRLRGVLAQPEGC